MRAGIDVERGEENEKGKGRSRKKGAFVGSRCRRRFV